MKVTIRMWARRIKRDVMVLWFARKHPDTPLLAKVICVLAVLYALSPIDLVPDFVPILGYVDDMLLLPALIWLAVRLLPSHVLVSCREQANDWMSRQDSKPTSYIGAVIVVLLWCVVAYLFWRWI
ncbi:YkvA family protein [Herminiimonas sp. NPDC097707]|uniref:YkvA family protein n=1 Tax=Herminiimonas sp. NPDC097707 TaxID=3364007 RepID=UPI00383A6226